MQGAAGGSIFQILQNLSVVHPLELKIVCCCTARQAFLKRKRSRLAIKTDAHSKKSAIPLGWDTLGSVCQPAGGGFQPAPSRSLQPQCRWVPASWPLLASSPIAMARMANRLPFSSAAATSATRFALPSRPPIPNSCRSTSCRSDHHHHHHCHHHHHRGVVTITIVVTVIAIHSTIAYVHCIHFLPMALGQRQPSCWKTRRESVGSVGATQHISGVPE